MESKGVKRNGRLEHEEAAREERGGLWKRVGAGVWTGHGEGRSGG